MDSRESAPFSSEEDLHQINKMLFHVTCRKTVDATEEAFYAAIRFMTEANYDEANHRVPNAFCSEQRKTQAKDILLDLFAARGGSEETRIDASRKFCDDIDDMLRSIHRVICADLINEPLYYTWVGHQTQRIDIVNWLKEFPCISNIYLNPDDDIVLNIQALYHDGNTDSDEEEEEEHESEAESVDSLVNATQPQTYPLERPVLMAANIATSISSVEAEPEEFVETADNEAAIEDLVPELSSSVESTEQEEGAGVEEIQVVAARPRLRSGVRRTAAELWANAEGRHDDEPLNKRMRRDENDARPARSSDDRLENSDVNIPGRCMICLDFFHQIVQDKDRQLATTQCGHVFCARCVETALENKRQCPTCRELVSRRRVRKVFL